MAPPYLATHGFGRILLAPSSTRRDKQLAGLAKGGTGVLSVDGKEVDRKTIPHTIPIIMTNDETFDIGIDTYTGVDDFEYQLPFRFTGAIDKLTFNLGPEQLSADDKQDAAKKLAVAKD